MLYQLLQPNLSNQETLWFEEFEEVNNYYFEWEEELKCGKIFVTHEWPMSCQS